MKKLEDVLDDIEKLVGKKLQSIHPSAELIVENIDRATAQIWLRTSKGVRRSRPIAEIENLWTSLRRKPAIHVDSEFGGSGSSRNQPETILANLPYVEWFRHSRKKHLALVETASHALGTLRPMDPLVAEERGRRLEAERKTRVAGKAATVVVVTDDPAGDAETIERASGIKERVPEQGIYEYSLPSCRLLLVSVGAVHAGVPRGTYLVLEGSPPEQDTEIVKIADERFVLHVSEGLRLLYQLKT